MTVFPGAMLLDIAGPLQVFEAASRFGAGPDGRPAYEVAAVSAGGGPAPTDLGIPVVTRPWSGLGGSGIDTLLVPGGPGAWAASADPAFVRQVQLLSGRARRTASVCLGAFILAECGLLEGRKAVTHWRYCDALARKYPGVRVDPDPIFVRDGPVWTSAGVTAGIDLALAMVEEDLGHAVALDVARSLVVYLKRPGSQAQFSAALSAQAEDRNGRFADLQAWMMDNLASDLRVERLADRSAMAPRSFARAFSACMGAPPAKVVEAMRVEAARRMLEQRPREPIGAIARRCGFNDDERMRRAFIRALGVNAAEYRARFGQGRQKAPALLGRNR